MTTKIDIENRIKADAQRLNEVREIEKTMIGNVSDIQSLLNVCSYITAIEERIDKNEERLAILQMDEM